MGSKSTTVQKADPWAPAQPYILEGLNAAQAMWNSNPNGFVIDPWQGRAVADERPELEWARNATVANYAPQAQYLGQAQQGVANLAQQAAYGGSPDAFNSVVGGATGTPYVSGRTSFAAPQMAQSYYAPQASSGSAQGLPGIGLPPVSSGSSIPPTSPGTTQPPSNTGGSGSDFLTGIVQQVKASTPTATPSYWGPIGIPTIREDPRTGTQNESPAAQAARQAEGARKIAEFLKQSSPETFGATAAAPQTTAAPAAQQTAPTAQQPDQWAAIRQALQAGGTRTNAPMAAQSAASLTGQTTTRSAGPMPQQTSAQRPQQSTGYNPMSLFQQTVQNAGMDPMGQGIRAGIRQNVAEGVMPAVNSTFGTGGMAGSSLHSAAAAKAMASGLAPYELQASNAAANRALQAGGMAADTAMQGAQMSQQAQLANRAQALQAFGMAPGMSQASYNPISQVQGVGEARTQRDQQQLAADIMAHQQNQAAPIDAINNYLALTSGLGGQFGTSMSTASQNPGMLGIMGGGLQGIGLLGSLGLLSDVRAKENIRKVGQLDNGLPVYVYTYKGDHTPHMGVMAQEAMQTNPEAVAMREDGMLAVHYGVLAEGI